MTRETDTLYTSRLRFRKIEPEDAVVIVKWRSDPLVYQYFKNPHRICIEEHLKWYWECYLPNKDRIDWICIDYLSGTKIGVFGLIHDGDVAEVSYLLAPEAQHKGYATEGITRLIKYAKERWSVQHIVAEIHKENAPSIAVVKRLNFQLISEDDSFIVYGVDV